MRITHFNSKHIFPLVIGLIYLLCDSCSLNKLTPTVEVYHTPDGTVTIVDNQTSTVYPLLITTQTSTITTTATMPNVTSTSTSPTITTAPTEDILQTINGRIAFTSLKTGLIEMVDVNGDNWVQLTNKLCYFNRTVSWSPDGHWVAFTCSFEQFKDLEIYIVNINNGEVRQITNSPGSKIDTTWSPDGQYMAYVEEEQDRSDDISIINVESGETRKLTYTSALEVKPSWSPDGKMIAFLQYNDVELDSVARLMVMNFDNGDIRTVTDFPVGWSRLTWSPDSKEIAFVSAEDCGELYVIDADGSDLRRLTNIDVGCPIDPNWSPDGQYIAFNMSMYNTTDSWKQRLFILDLEENGIYQVAPNRDWNPLSPAWQPVPLLQVGQEYTITNIGNHLNLRQSPSLKGVILTQLMTGDFVTVLEGPVDKDNYYWWRMRTKDGTEGWAVEMLGWYQPTDR